MAVEIDINYLGDLRCHATHGPSRQTLTTDAPLDNGGKGEAFSPTDLVATALGSCLITVMSLDARRAGFDLAGATIHVVKEMVADPIRRIGTLRATVTLPDGKRLAAADRARLEQIANTCPVKASLHPDVNVVMDFAYPD